MHLNSMYSVAEGAAIGQVLFLYWAIIIGIAWLKFRVCRLQPVNNIIYAINYSLP